MIENYLIEQIFKRFENLKLSDLIYIKKTNSLSNAKIKDLIKKKVINNNKIFQKQAFIFKKSNIAYEEEFSILREKILNYLQKDSEVNNIIPVNTKLYVPVCENKNGEEEIIMAYPSVLYYRLKKRNLSFKQGIQECEQDIKYRTTYFNLLFNSEPFRKYCSRRARYELISSIQNQLGLLIPDSPSLLDYDYLLDIIHEFFPDFNIKIKRPSDKLILSEREYMKQNFLLKERSLLFPKNQSLGQRPIVLGFLNGYDAEIYKKQIIKNYGQKKVQRSILNAKKIKLKLNGSIKIKRTILSNIKYFFNNFENFEGETFSNSFILVPKFFTYSGKRKRKRVQVDFPVLMLSPFGFGGIPVYKTKPISKKILLSNQKNFKELGIRQKYLKTKTIFITLNKNEYKKFAKIDKRNKIFYDLEENLDHVFTSSLKKVIREKHTNSLKEFEKVLIKIKNKIKTLEKVKLLKQFIFDNYDENNLLEKTSYYIDKINKQNLKQNLN